MKRLSCLIILIFFAIGLNITFAGEKEDLEKLRQDQLELLGSEGLTRPYDIRERAMEYLAMPLSQQTVVGLKELSRSANVSTNLIGMILEEYNNYYSDNYRYEFVQKEIAPFRNQFISLSNELKDYRNQCYFNLGEKLKNEGKDLEAFLYYRDAYRLSSFTESESDHKGMRYKAEQKLKELLGISDIPSFVYWE